MKIRVISRVNCDGDISYYLEKRIFFWWVNITGDNLSPVHYHEKDNAINHALLYEANHNKVIDIKGAYK